MPPVVLDKELRKQFGARVKQLRKHAEWSQKDLATKLDTSLPQLNKYEGGFSMPPAEKLLQLAEIFDTTVDYLLTGDQREVKPLHNLRLLDRFRALENFERNDQEAVITMIDALIVKQRVTGALKPVGTRRRTKGA